MDPPGHTPHPHHNQQVTALGRAESTRVLLADRFSIGRNWRFLVFRRGRIEGTFYNKVANCNGSAWSHTSPTPQSTSDCVGAGRINQGVAGRPIFYRAKLEIFGVSKGEDRGDILQQGGQLQWIRLVTHLTHTTINK